VHFMSTRQDKELTAWLEDCKEGRRMLGSTSTKNHHAYFTRGIIGLNKRSETAEESYHEETKMNY